MTFKKLLKDLSQELTPTFLLLVDGTEYGGRVLTVNKKNIDFLILDAEGRKAWTLRIKTKAIIAVQKQLFTTENLENGSLNTELLDKSRD